MKIESNVSLSGLTTFRVGGAPREVITIERDPDIPDAISRAHELMLPWSVVGGGSNLLVSDGDMNRVILHMKTRGIAVVSEDDDSVTVRAEAGEPWSALISWSVEHDLWGIENLAGIPGTVGATPVQNVGAYGAEVSSVIVSVSAFDAVRGEFVEITREACAFGYRDSVFKRPEGERFVIASVTFRFSKRPHPELSYKDIKDRFQGVDPMALKPSDIAQAVIDIRSGKFPDLSQVGTAGSFFKNPIISRELYGTLRQRFPELPGHEHEDRIKIPLAWILDNVCHLKGHRVGSVALFERQPLVLVAYEGATAHDIDTFANDIARHVYDATNIVIEREVRELK